MDRFAPDELDRGRRLAARLRVEIRRFNLMGDTTWCRGRVTAKRRDDDGRGLIDLDVWAEDQRGETTAKGVATVELPTR